jgi:hypothetical protein
MGRVQGGARSAFATPSWGPSRITFIPKKNTSFQDIFFMIFSYLYKKILYIFLWVIHTP